MIKKKGLPEEDELVLCTVKTLLPHCAFVTLDEYESLEGMLHISEVSLRGVKNIKDHLSEGKKLVCKVLRVSDKGEVDVSLKRVKKIEMKRKLNEERISKRLYKLIEHAIKKAKLKVKVDLIVAKLIDEFGSLANLYEELRNKGVLVLKETKISPDVRKVLEKSFNELLEQISVSIKRELLITSDAGDGISLIKKLLSSVKDGEDYSVKIIYLGSPRYSFKITSKNYKIAENAFSKIYEDLTEKAKKLGVLVKQVEK